MNLELASGIEDTIGSATQWRNLATGECRRSPPPAGDLDWAELVGHTPCFYFR